MSIEEQRKAADEVREVAIWCLERRGRCWRGWSADKIFKYIAWHLLNGTLFIVREAGEIKAVAICWRVKLNDLLTQDKEGQPPFKWTALEPVGDATLLGDYFGSRQYGKALFDQFAEKWKTAIRDPFCTYRNGKLHQLKAGRLERFLNV